MYLLAAGALFLPVPVSAQDDGIEDEFALLEEELSADEVTSASKHRQSVFWSPSAINVFTKQDIRASGATSLSDLLRRVPSFDVYNMKHSYTLVGARAMTNQNNNLVLLLVDGREDMVELTGMALWNGVSFDLEQVERIEVIRGPGSALYGANAFAAVISVTTMPDRPSESAGFLISAAEQRENYMTGRVGSSVELGGGTLTWRAHVGYLKRLSPSDTRDDAQVGLKTHNYVRYRRGRDLDLSLAAGAISGNSTVYMFAGDLLVDDVFSPWLCGKAEFGLGESTRLKAQVYFNRYVGLLHFRTQVRGYDLWIADLPDIDWKSNTIDGQVHFVQSDFLGIDDLLLIAGSNIRYSILSGGESLLLSDEDEVRGAGFIHVQWEPIEFIQLTAGLRLDGSDMTDPSLSPRGVVVFRPWSKQAFRAGYGLAFRKPSLFELLSHIRVDNFNPAFPEIVDKLRDDVGNKDLDNMQVRSLEVGWRGRFLDDQLQVAVDFFYNEYKNSIEFTALVPLRLGLPDIPNSEIGFSNTSSVHPAYGSEIELSWHPDNDWFFWCNLALRQLTYSGEIFEGRSEPEPKVRVNLGGRFYPDTGLFADLAVHYVSAYTMYLPDPGSILDLQDLSPLGPNLLMIGRLGYRQKLGDASELEMGMTIRTPLMAPFREFPGMPMPSNLRLDTAADFGGELLHRQVAFYLRGSF